MSFKRALCQSEESKYESLLSLLSNVFIKGKKLILIFGSAFSCRSSSRELEGLVIVRVTS